MEPRATRPEPRRTILIIDDHEDTVQFLAEVLRQDYDVLAAQDGLDGYALACQRRPAAVVLDLMMPLVDGWTVVRKLRSNPATAHAPVVVVTALEADAVKAEAARHDVAAVLRKPVDPADLRRAVDRALRLQASTGRQ